MREDIKSMPRVHRDAMNNGTWIDGEFHSDKKLLARKGRVTTYTVDTSSTMRGTDNSVIAYLSTPHDTPNYLWNTFVTGRKQGKTYAMRKHFYPCKLCGKIKYGGDKCQNCCKSFWPTKKSRIGSLFYIGAMVCSRLLRKWVFAPTQSTIKIKGTEP